MANAQDEPERRDALTQIDDSVTAQTKWTVDAYWGDATMESDLESTLGYYEEAMLQSLGGDHVRRCYLQNGSTLRNVGRRDDSVRVFAVAQQQFPDSVSLQAFEALTLHDAGRPSPALGSALELIADHVADRRTGSLRGRTSRQCCLSDRNRRRSPMSESWAPEPIVGSHLESDAPDDAGDGDGDVGQCISTQTQRLTEGGQPLVNGVRWDC